MMKFLSPANTFIKYFVTLAVAVVFTYGQVAAQCGLSSFSGPGSPYTPSTSFQLTQPLGSGTYDDFNVTNGNIYSFYFTSTTAPTTGKDWDMTVSSTSATITYNNSISPLPNSWTNGANCPATPRPTSTDWFATYSGTLRINVKSWDNVTGCHDWVQNQGSAVLEYKECVPTADPGPGNNNWNVEAFATTDVALPPAIIGARYGVYVDNASGTNFVTTNYWAQNSNPSTASGWSGCQMPNNNYVVRGRRAGFPCGAYTITVNKAANNIVIFLNGTQIYSGTNINAATTVGNYALTNTDIVEVRVNNVCVNTGAVANVSITPFTPTAINGGTIGGVVNNSNICPNQVIGNFTNVTLGSGGVTAYNNSAPLTYTWELSTNGGGNFTPVPGVTTSFWNSNTTVPAGSTYIIKRVTTDECGNRASSNVITVYGRPAPNGSISPTTQTVCPGSPATLTFNFNPGTAPFKIVYTNGLTTSGLNNLTNGSSVQVTPPYTTTYSFDSITDAYGCVTTSGFNSGAAVIVTTPINVSGVTVSDVQCNGGSNGSITVNANGGQPPLSFSIDGGNTFQSSNVFTNLTIGNYTVVVRDNLGCNQAYATNPVVVNQPTPVSVSLSKTDASCIGVFDGTITITAGGGTPPYSYALNGGPTQSSNVITGLQPGTYNVSVFDSHNCAGTGTITINGTYVVTLDTISTSNISCYGQGNGALTVQLSGGIPAYQYSINGFTFQNSGTFNGLSASNYIVIGRDSKGCSAAFNVNITSPTQLVVGIDSVINVLCNGTPSGAIYTHVSGGTPGYLYNWSNGNVTTANDLNIPGGSYNVTVTDSRGCTATNGATVTTPSVLSLNIALYNNPFCHNDSSGTILLQANGGVAPYAYSWTNGATTQDIDSLPAGNYAVTVTDANGCQQSISQALTNPLAITTSVSSTNVTCAGAANGTASVLVSGGLPSYTYLWSNFQVTPSVSNLAGGTYHVVVTDRAGCQHTDSVVITEPAALAVTAAVTNVSCFNANDGAATLTVTGGTAPYTYAWSNGATTSTITNQPGETVAVTVTDANHCAAVISVTIINPTQIIPNTRVTNVLCFGDANGAVNLNPSGGTPGYTYVWGDGSTNSAISGLAPGTYYFTITDSRGCSTNDSAKVTSPSALYTSGILKNVSCNGICDGSILTTAYGGTLPYTFSWSHGPSTQDVILLCGGSYYLTVTDANQCQVASLYIIHEPAVLAQTLHVTDNTCYGACNGSLASTPTGGTTPYQYLWSNFGTDSLQTGLCAGRYTILLTDSNGCHLNDTVSVGQPAQIVINGTVTNVACSGFNTGAINLAITGGATPFTFAWSNSATTQNLTALVSGPYIVTATDAHGCSQTASFYVNQSEVIHTTASLNQPRCAGGNDGFISVVVTGGIIPYRYSWSTSPVQIGATATNLTAGTYTLTVTDSIGCSATVSSNLTNPTALSVVTPGLNSRCYNNPSGSVVALASGGFPPYNYTLNGVFQTSDTFSGLAPGHYVVLVMDANGCQGTGAFNIASASHISVSLSVTDQRILTGMETQLSASATSDTTIIHYFWTPIAIDSVDVFDYRSCTDSSNCSTPYVKPPFTTTFTVQVMNADSCFATDTITVYVDNEPGSFAPTAFTPNGDGLNDRFALAYLGATKIEVTIFNRWGEKIYYNPDQTNNLAAADGWDGTDHGKPSPTGTYVYQAKVTYFDGVVKNKTGTVSLIR